MMKAASYTQLPPHQLQIQALHVTEELISVKLPTMLSALRSFNKRRSR